MSLKKFLQRIWDFIGSIWRGLSDEVKVLVPKAYVVLENLKNYTDDDEADVLTKLTKGDFDDKALAALREWIPKILDALFPLGEINAIADQNERLKAIIKQMNVGSDEAKKVWYRGFVSLILEKLSDGVYDSADAAAVMEYYYKHRNDPAAIE
jgi:hypothetical protein